MRHICHHNIKKTNIAKRESLCVGPAYNAVGELVSCMANAACRLAFCCAHEACSIQKKILHGNAYSVSTGVCASNAAKYVTISGACEGVIKFRRSIAAGSEYDASCGPDVKLFLFLTVVTDMICMEISARNYS